jgi:hypothetical protein
VSAAHEAYRAGMALGLLGGASIATTVAIMVDLYRRDRANPRRHLDALARLHREGRR